MTTDLVAKFEDSLADLDVDLTPTTTDRFASTLSDIWEEPVVGAPLPFDDLSLPDGIVTAPTPEDLKNAATGVTAVGAGIAEYGTVIVQSRPWGDEAVSLYPPLHVGILQESDLLPDMSAGVVWLDDEFAAGRDSAVLTSGPSATGDMGKLVRRVHGPLDVHIILVTDQ